MPEEIAEAVAAALELAELVRGGATFPYPDAHSPVKWACVKGLTRGRDRAEELQRERDKKERRRKEAKDRFNQNG